MKAYTLVEVIISVLLLAIVLFGGTALFYQNLKLAGLSDVDSNLNNSVESLLRSMENDARFSEVTRVGSGVRTDCLAAGASGYMGDSLAVADLTGSETVYSLAEGKIASTSSQTGQVSYTSPSSVTIELLQFTWYCQNGISDKIKIAINASSNSLSTGIKVDKSSSIEINLFNSGLN